VPDNAVEVYVLDPLAIDVKLVFVGQARNEFRHAALGTVPLVNKRGDYGYSAAGRRR
jgi:hypothetical protein